MPTKEAFTAVQPGVDLPQSSVQIRHEAGLVVRSIAIQLEGRRQGLYKQALPPYCRLYLPAADLPTLHKISWELPVAIRDQARIGGWVLPDWQSGNTLYLPAF